MIVCDGEQCGKNCNQVKTMIVLNPQRGLAICSECVDRCVKIITEKQTKKAEEMRK